MNLNISSIFYTSFLLILFFCTVIRCEDFYELLNVPREASLREIRKAFKKIALKSHPDKNPDDPNANEKFVKINKAYEVLKDEDLRKKYDTYGEEGLKEDGPSGRGFKSWNFYNQDFGIYDNDDEIVTLSRMDFEQSVENSPVIWFVNYYSPQCSHCHELAPTWREVARDLEGVIRIGAVNCGDEWMLCRQQGIRSYPTLVMYPSREKYYGDRTAKTLVKHALREVGAKVAEMWSGNFNSIMDDGERNSKPWIISFCGEGGDCLLHQTAMKLAAMLDELANVGEINCHSNEKLCSKLGVEHGTYYFPAKEVEKGKGIAISTLDAKEIAFVVLEQLPDMTDMNSDAFLEAMANLNEGKDTPWLIHFVEGSHHDLELRKLPAYLSPMNLGRIDCRNMRSVCNDFHMNKLPKFVLFKTEGRYEIHHGRLTTYDIAAFAKDSADNTVTVLGPDDFPQRVIEGNEPWVVDFFAPWCPPCMALLPEFRKASKNMGDKIKFGTVDCTVHPALCQKYKVGSYPTTIFYNQSTPHIFQGHHQASSIVEFIQDTMVPPVIALNEQSFEKLVANKEEKDIWLVDFFAPWCGPCQQLAPEWRRLAKMLGDTKNIKIAHVDCEANSGVCQKQNVRSYPSVRLYPQGRMTVNGFHQYTGWYRDAPSLRAWAFEFLPSLAKELTWGSFNSDVLTSEGPWLVDFFTPWCGHCQVFAPEFERIAKRMEGRNVGFGKVDCDKNQQLCQQAGIRAYPSVRFYRGAKNGQHQGFFGEDLNSQNGDYIIQYLEQKLSKKAIKGKQPRHDEF